MLDFLVSEHVINIACRVVSQKNHQNFSVNLWIAHLFYLKLPDKSGLFDAYTFGLVFP